jgi:hypothetical protein
MRIGELFCKFSCLLVRVWHESGNVDMIEWVCKVSRCAWTMMTMSEECDTDI